MFSLLDHRGDHYVRARFDASTPQIPKERMDLIFQATVEATEDAIVNAMIAARTMTGADGWRF